MLFLAENNGVLFESHWDTPPNKKIRCFEQRQKAPR